MIDYETYTYTGDCPHTESEQTISIVYAKITMSKVGTGYKKTDYKCPLSTECSYSVCPVYNSASSNPEL